MIFAIDRKTFLKLSINSYEYIPYIQPIRAEA